MNKFYELATAYRDAVRIRTDAQEAFDRARTELARAEDRVIELSREFCRAALSDK